MKFRRVMTNLFVMVGVFALVYAFSIVFAHGISDSHASAQVPKHPQAKLGAEPTRGFHIVHSVDLPPGVRFLHLIPAVDAEKYTFATPGKNIYVTSSPEQYPGGPRVIRYFQAGGSPGSWSEILQVQER